MKKMNVFTILVSTTILLALCAGGASLRDSRARTIATWRRVCDAAGPELPAG